MNATLIFAAVALAFIAAAHDAMRRWVAIRQAELVARAAAETKAQAEMIARIDTLAEIVNKATDFHESMSADLSALSSAIGNTNATHKTYAADQEALIKRLAEEWKAKFVMLEMDWQGVKEHATSQYSGAVAQIASQQTRGFNR